MVQVVAIQDCVARNYIQSICRQQIRNGLMVGTLLFIEQKYLFQPHFKDKSDILVYLFKYPFICMSCHLSFCPPVCSSLTNIFRHFFSQQPKLPYIHLIFSAVLKGSPSDLGMKNLQKYKKMILILPKPFVYYS